MKRRQYYGKGIFLGKKNSPLVKSSSFYLGQLIFKVLYFVTRQKIGLVGTLSKLRFPSRNQYGRWPRD